MRSEVRPLIGSASGRPAGSTNSRSRHCVSAIGRSSLGLSPSFRPAIGGMPKMRWTVGRRRSASMSSTRRWYDSLSVSARLTAVRLLPSPGSALDVMMTLMPRSVLRMVQDRGELAVLLLRGAGENLRCRPACRPAPDRFARWSARRSGRSCAIRLVPPTRRSAAVVGPDEPIPRADRRVAWPASPEPASRASRAMHRGRDWHAERVGRVSAAGMAHVGCAPGGGAGRSIWRAGSGRDRHFDRARAGVASASRRHDGSVPSGTTACRRNRNRGRPRARHRDRPAADRARTR